MTRRVNYADNIFYLKLILKQVGAGLKLAVDADLARDRVLEDLGFLQRSAGGIFASLRENHLLIERSEHLQQLAGFYRQYLAVLEELAAGKPAAAPAVLAEGGREVVERIREAIRREQAELRLAISSHRLGAGDHEHIVSEEEFRFLLSPEEGGEGGQAGE
jgi:hypothetical protein